MIAGAVAEFDIDAIADGGDGVGRADGLVAFVPRTAPGDRVRARLTTRRGGRFARGTLVELARASAERVEPRCIHYTRDRCGGCQLQHLAYDAQLAAKSRIVRDALERIGHRTIDAPIVRPSPAPWHYRRKLTLALRRRRDGAWIAGLHPFDDPHAVFPLDDCPITDARVLDVWRAVMAVARFPVGDALRASVRVDAGRASLVVEGGARWPDHAALFAAVPALTSLWWARDGGTRCLHQRASDDAAAADASFAQVNAPVAAAVRDHAVSLVRRYAPATAVDGYAGTGDTALALAGSGIRVTAIELDARAVARCAARLPAGSSAVEGRVEDRIGAALPADVVVLNPPRTGVDARVAKAIAGARPAPRAVVYVSCDPATLARDVARLGAFRIASLECFDMFPQTAHVETVCELVPEAA